MHGLRRLLGRLALGCYSRQRGLRSKLLSFAGAGGFYSFGRHTVLELPVRLIGAQRMAIGNHVWLGAGSCLQCIGEGGDEPALIIGNGSSIAGTAVISAAQHVRLGERVLLARNVYIADHQHAFENLGVAVLEQGITRVSPVEIGDGAWLGQNVVVGPGVSIGIGAVIGANSVVLDDVPAYSVAVGAPARVVRTFDGGDAKARIEAVT